MACQIVEGPHHHEGRKEVCHANAGLKITATGICNEHAQLMIGLH